MKARKILCAQPVFPPMTKTEKEAKIKSFEDRYAKAFLAESSRVEEVQIVHGFDELPTTDFKLDGIKKFFVPQQVSNNTIKTLSEFYRRLNALVNQTDLAVLELKETLSR